jgi:hypothetical protein
MDFIRNIKYIEKIVSRQGAYESFEEEELELLQVYVEMETRTLIENAVKYMMKDGRN